MSRGVRMVPSDWEHPKNQRGFVPLFNSMPPAEFERQVQKWHADAKLWAEGKHPDQKYDEERSITNFEDWDGPPLDLESHMPLWEDAERTHYQMYECTSEGTPISPVLETPEELARWLVDNEASTFANMTTDYDTWLSLIVKGTGSFGMGIVVKKDGTIDEISGVDLAAGKEP